MVILIHGEDTYSSRQYLNSIITQFKQKHDAGGTGVVVFGNDEEVSWERLAAAITADGLFTEKKLVIAKNVLGRKELRESLQEFLEARELAPGATLVLFESGSADKRSSFVKKLLAEKYSREFGIASAGAVERMMQGHAESLDARIEPAALRLLSEIVGTNVWRARNEIEKLVHASGGAITEQDVRAHTRASLEDDIWQFVDALSNGDKTRALRLLEQQLASGAAPLYLLAMIVRQFRLLLALHGALGADAELASSLKVHPFAVKKTRQQSRRFTVARLSGIYLALGRLDRALKSGRGEPKVLFTVLVDSVVK